MILKEANALLVLGNHFDDLLNFLLGIESVSSLKGGSNTTFQMVSKNFHFHRFEGGGCGTDLGQDVRAVAMSHDHSFDTLDLPLDPIQPFKVGRMIWMRMGHDLALRVSLT